MAKRTGRPPQMGNSQVKSLAGVVLKMFALGFAGGLALIAGAEKVGSKIEQKTKTYEDIKEGLNEEDPE
ncbi:MAG: hypothetical protein HUJ78_04875 [Mogibacterium sp.]|nr:hypothetical protein [Mogibacterium sp.]